MKIARFAGTAAAALVLAAPVMAQTAGSSADLAAAQAQIDALKQQLERLEATVDYLKANASAEHKEKAEAASDVAALKAASDKYTWSGDFRFRHDMQDRAPNDTTSGPHPPARPDPRALRGAGQGQRQHQRGAEAVYGQQ